MASQVVRAAGGSSSTTTLAFVGIGAFCLANPEKALQLLQRALLALNDGSGSNLAGRSGNHASAPQPIVIHAGGPSTAGGGSSGRAVYYAIVQLGLGAGLCWGSYALLVNILPEQAKNMLPVTQGTFKSAVTSLGKGLLQVKDTLSAEISALLQQQTELGHKQDETHEQVLYVQDQVADVHDDLDAMQNSLDDCHKALQSTDKRTTYIAKGIRLVTQGMTAMLPPDDELVKELRSFQKTTADHAVTNVPRNKADNNVDSNGSRSGSSRRSRRSTSESRRRPSSRRASHSNNNMTHGNNKANDAPRNKPSNAVAYNDSPCCSSDTLSVSTGTPVRAVVFPRKTASDEVSITSADRDLKELDDVRALLLQMEQRTRLTL